MEGRPTEGLVCSRANFEDLAVSKQADKSDPFQVLVCQCLQKGISSNRSIAEELNQKSFKANKSKIAYLMKNCPTVQNARKDLLGHQEVA